MNRPTSSTRATSELTALPDQLVQMIAALHDKKASQVVVLDLRESGAFTDYFVICSGHNPRQIKAMVDATLERAQQLGRKPSHVEGYARTEWVLLDFFDFVVHVFTPETRAFYDLERLWGSAKRLEVADTSSSR